MQETCIIKDARNLLEKKGQEAWHQIARLQEVRQHILRDLGEKIVALDIDRYLLNLNESSTEISFRYARLISTLTWFIRHLFNL